jgi:hypothetical protein
MSLASCRPDETSTPPPTATPSSRWEAYESALADAFLPPPGEPSEGLCEWEILGEGEQEIYVWAMCQVKVSATGAAMSAPAVIYLGDDGEIQRVEHPGDGLDYGTGVRRLFPADLHERVFYHHVDPKVIWEPDVMWEHINSRREHPEPPLIELSGTPLP